MGLKLRHTYITSKNLQNIETVDEIINPLTYFSPKRKYHVLEV